MSVQRKPPQQSRRTTFNVDTTSWWNAVRQKSDFNESRFGVRKRVRTVLDKAKKRTGIENGTDGQPQPGVSLNGVTQSFVQSGLNIMAEAASVGGLGEVEIFDETRLEYISRGMGEIQPVNLSDDTTRAAAAVSLTTIALSSYAAERYDNLGGITQEQEEFVGLAKLAEDVNGGAPVKENGVTVNASTPPPVSAIDPATASAEEDLIKVTVHAAGEEVVTSAAPSSLLVEPLPFDLLTQPEQPRLLV